MCACVFTCYLLRTISIYSTLAFTSSPYEDQRPFLIWWNSIFRLGVSFRTKLWDEVRLGLGIGMY